MGAGQDWEFQQESRIWAYVGTVAGAIVKSHVLCGQGKDGVSKTASSLGGARQEVPASSPDMDKCGRGKEVIRNNALYGRARHEFQKSHPMWAGPHIEFQQAGHIFGSCCFMGSAAVVGHRPYGSVRD